MSKIRFEDGTVVNFDGDPTPQDVEEVSNSLKIQKPVQPTQNLTPKPIEKSMGILEKAKLGVKDFGIGSLKGLGSTATSLGQLTLKGAKAISPFESVDKYLQGGIEEGERQKETTLKSEGTMQEIGKGAEQFAEFFIPVGTGAKIASNIPKLVKESGILTKAMSAFYKPAVKSITTGTEMGAKTYLQTGDIEQAKDVGIMSAVVPPVAGILKKAGGELFKTAIPYSKQEAKLIQSYKANVPFWDRVLGIGEKSPVTTAQTAFEKGMWGTESMMGVQAKQGTTKLWKVIEPELKKSPVKVNMEIFFKETEKSIIKNNPELSRQKILLEALKAFKSDYKGVKEVSLDKLQGFKQGWAKFIPEKAYQGKPIAGAANDVKDILADNARTIIHSNISPEASKAYYDYGNLLSLQEMGQKSMAGTIIKGGTGTTIQSILSSTITPIITTGGQVLYKTAEGIEFIAPKGMKTVNDIFR